MGEIITIIVIAVIGYSIKVAVDNKKQKSASQSAPISGAQTSESLDIFNAYKNQTKQKEAPKPIKNEVKPTIKPTIRDHLHGTTIQTSKQNCEKPHDGTYKSNFNVKSISEEKKVSLSDEELKKIMLIGDAIANPAFKRRKNGMR